MSIQIQLDRPDGFYTNLDFLTGSVILRLPMDESVSAVIVKLEGESKSQLQRPSAPQYTAAGYPSRKAQRDVWAMENHKILYRVSQVFPDPNVLGTTSIGAKYMLRAGTYKYPFRFKLPFNNSCADPHVHQQQMGFNNLGLGGIQQLQYRHVRKSLPPSLTGWGDAMEIRYYVKVTVQRPSLLKENRRAALGFSFMPIEPPRPPENSPKNEVFAKRPYAFQAGLAPYARTSSAFGKAPVPMSQTPPSGEVDARLPSPAILTSNKPLPLRVIIKKMNTSPEHVFLVSLQIHVIGLTSIRAQGVEKTVRNMWVLTNMTGLSVPIITPDKPPGTEIILDSTMWNQTSLPSTITPSFQTCNVSRSYKLEVHVGLGYGHPQDIQVSRLGSSSVLVLTTLSHSILCFH